jgi:hypothetical protein
VTLGDNQAVALCDALTDYLRDRRDDARRSVLIGALRDGGYLLEARLLERADGAIVKTVVDRDGGAWSGRRAWVGWQLPQQPRAGDIWLDTCELMPMLLLPRTLEFDASEYAPGVLERMTPFVSWLALRPVAAWQFASFLRLARIEPRRVQITPPIRPLDAERILACGEGAPVTSLLPGEVSLYAGWFGKGIARHEDWQAASGALSQAELDALWGPPHREWAGAVDEGLYAVVSPDTVTADIHAVLGDDEHLDKPDRLIFGELETPSDVAFRTAVSTQVGLLGAGSDPLSILDVEVVDGVERD